MRNKVGNLCGTESQHFIYSTTHSHTHTHMNTQMYEPRAGLVAGGCGVLHRMNCDAIIVGSKSVDQHNNNNSMQQ